MSNHSASGIGQVLKMLIVTVCKLVGICILFTCRIASAVFGKIAELIEKLIGHGSH